MFNTRCFFCRTIVISFLICGLSASLILLSGCTPLRKKFKREKKNDPNVGSKFIPVLDPVDYPEAVHLPEEHYKHHYSLWKVWNRDLLQVIERDGSDKRQKYLLYQSVGELENMKKWLADAKQNELDGLIDELRQVGQLYEKPPSMRSKFSTRKKIELNAKAVRNGFSPKLNLPYREL